jgi:hypothetical protein
LYQGTTFNRERSWFRNLPIYELGQANLTCADDVGGKAGQTGLTDTKKRWFGSLPGRIRWGQFPSQKKHRVDLVLDFGVAWPRRTKDAAVWPGGQYHKNHG